MNYKRNKKYFSGNIGLIVLSITSFCSAFFTFFAGLMESTDIFSENDGPNIWYIITGILVLTGIITVILSIKCGITDKEIDNEIFGYLSRLNLRERALFKLGLDESEISEIAPICFDGYMYDGVNEIKIGKDNKARSSQGRIVYLFFTKNEIHCYNYVVSLIGNYTSEYTDTFFYNDIVSVATTTASGTYNSSSISQNIHSYQYDCFKLTTTGGTSIQVGLRDVASAEIAIAAMRNLIKEKKQ